MKNYDPGQLVYTVQKLREPFAPATDTDRTNEIYQFWKGVWLEVFGAIGQADALSPDDFFRQDLLTHISTKDGEPVALHLYTFFDLASDFDKTHSYFGELGEMGLANFKRLQCRRLMSMEYLTVNAEWRKSKSGMAFGDTVIGLGLRVMKAAGYDAAIGTPRADVGVDRAAECQGFVTVQNGIKKYDYTCSLVVCKADQAHAHPDAKTNQLIDTLWTNRVDNTGLTLNNATKTAKTAA